MKFPSLFAILFSACWAFSSATEDALGLALTELRLQHTEAGVGKCLAGPVVDVTPHITLPEGLQTSAILTCRREDFTLAYKLTDRSVVARTELSVAGASPCTANYTTETIRGEIWKQVTLRFDQCGVVMTASPHVLSYSHRVKVIDYIAGRSAAFEHSQIINIDVHCDLVPQSDSTPLEPSCPEPPIEPITPDCLQCNFLIGDFEDIKQSDPGDANNLEFSIFPESSCFEGAGFYVQYCEVKSIAFPWISSDKYIPIQDGLPTSSGVKIYKGAYEGRYGYALSVPNWVSPTTPQEHILKKLGHQVECTVAVCKTEDTDMGDAEPCSKYYRGIAASRSFERRIGRSQRSARIYSNGVKVAPRA